MLWACQAKQCTKLRRGDIELRVDLTYSHACHFDYLAEKVSFLAQKLDLIMRDEQNIGRGPAEKLEDNNNNWWSSYNIGYIIFMLIAKW